MNLLEPYEILTDGHPILRQMAEEVQPGDNLGNMIERMVLTMQRAGGVGLAAPQIGISKRIIIVEITRGRPVAMINPTVTLSMRKRAFTEGCLSLPGTFRELIRWDFVMVKFKEPSGAEMTMSTAGLGAIIVQHEIDHLDGVLMTDRPTANEYIENLIEKEGAAAGHDFIKSLQRG